MHNLKLDLKPKLQRFSMISHRGIQGTFTGAGAQARGTGEKKPMLYRGKGLEFEKFREFTSDDDASLIDWKATLRAKKMLVKVYEEEQNKTIMFFLDVSNSMCYSSFGKIKAEYAAEVVLNLSFAISDSGDNMGLIMFTNKLNVVVPPNAGIRQHYHMLNNLKIPSHYGGMYNFSKAFKQLVGYLKTKALIVIVSDFIGLDDDWARSIKTASGNFEIIGIAIRDPADDYLPGRVGQVVISDPFSTKQLLIDPDQLKDRYDAYNKEHLGQIKEVFRKIQSDLLVLHTNKNFEDPVKKFFIV